MLFCFVLLGRDINIKSLKKESKLLLRSTELFLMWWNVITWPFYWPFFGPPAVVDSALFLSY